MVKNKVIVKGISIFRSIQMHRYCVVRSTLSLSPSQIENIYVLQIYGLRSKHELHGMCGMHGMYQILFLSRLSSHSIATLYSIVKKVHIFLVPLCISSSMPYSLLLSSILSYARKFYWSINVTYYLDVLMLLRIENSDQIHTVNDIFGSVNEWTVYNYLFFFYFILLNAVKLLYLYLIANFKWLWITKFVYALQQELLWTQYKSKFKQKFKADRNKSKTNVTSQWNKMSVSIYCCG